MKGSVALLAGALPAIVSCSHAVPPVREINSARSTPLSSGLASVVAIAFVVRPNPFPAASLGASGRPSSRSNAPRPADPRLLALVPTVQCAATRKRPGAGAVSFGSSSLAGVEGAFEAAATGLDRGPIARGVGVDGGVGAPAAAAADSGDDEALGAFSSAVASCAVVDEGELVCQKLEGVISREAAVAEQEVLLRVAHLDDYFAIAGEYIRKFHRPLPWSWELICRQLEEVVSQEAEVAEEQILLRMATLDDIFAISCEYAVSAR